MQGTNRLTQPEKQKQKLWLSNVPRLACRAPAVVRKQACLQQTNTYWPALPEAAPATTTASDSDLLFGLEAQDTPSPSGGFPRLLLGMFLFVSLLGMFLFVSCPAREVRKEAGREGSMARQLGRGVHPGAAASCFSQGCTSSLVLVRTQHSAAGAADGKTT